MSEQSNTSGKHRPYIDVTWTATDADRAVWAADAKDAKEPPPQPWIPRPARKRNARS